jgi:hypothetical protein
VSYFTNVDDEQAVLLIKILDLEQNVEQLETEIEILYSSLPLSRVWNERKLYQMRVEIINSILDINSISSNHFRRKLAKSFQQKYGLKVELAVRLANRIESVFNKLQSSRISGFALGKFNSLHTKQHGKCAHCYHNINTEHNTIHPTPKDVFRPYYWEDFHDWLDGEIDHVVPISRFGTDVEENLELICKACNQGKGAGLIENYTNQSNKYLKEYKSVTSKPSSKFHKFTLPLVYYRILIDNRMCTKCNVEGEPLTIRLFDEDFLPTVTNVRTLCYGCI